MTLSRRALILAAALCAAFALASATSASAATIGPYTVVDSVEYANGNTIATYKVTAPNGVKDISHISVQVCANIAQADIDTSPSSDYEPLIDPSTGLAGPLVKWDGGQKANGSEATYTITVPGQYAAQLVTMAIKTDTTYTGQVLGIGCEPPPPPPEEPPVEETPPTVNPPALVPPQPPVGEQQVLGERVEPGTAHIAGASGCQRKAFKISVRGRQIKQVVFRIDGKRVKSVRKSASGRVYSITINPNRFKPGSHVVSAKVTFTQASRTRSKTLRARFARCVRRVEPAFTG